MSRVQSLEPGAFLSAREEREAVVRRVLAEGSTTVVTLSLNIPGPDKNLPGCETLFARAAAALEGRLGRAARRAGGADGAAGVLGPCAVWRVDGDPAAVKRTATTIESSLHGGRLADVDVFDALGRQIDRRSLGLPPRPCFACEQPAHECARLGRHAVEDLLARVEGLLGDVFLDALAEALVSGSREELELTPKPGLVDRLDNGSHPDLTFELMSRSIGLLPEYFRDLHAALAAGRMFEIGATSAALRSCMEAGVRAEERMLREIGSNAHRGYIFLGGLALVAAAPAVPRNAAEYRARIAALASRVLDHGRPPAPPSHGDRLRRQLGLAGIHGEALAGLPSVFEHGLPALRRALGSGLGRPLAAHYAMAVLMQHVEDTTAVHRGGLPALDRLRADGRRVQAAIECGNGHLSLLTGLNEEYRAMRLTMGGVADCLALSLALEGSGVVLPGLERTA